MTLAPESQIEPETKRSASAATVGSDRSRSSGRLLGVTATGPVYLIRAKAVVVPLWSALALNHELAQRALDRRSVVVSSFAKRVRPEDAAKAQLVQTAPITASVTYLSPFQRVRFLRDVLEFVTNAGSADGNEAVVAAAINGAWPWLSANTLKATLERVATALNSTTFTDKFPTYVLDPNMRTVTFLAPGHLKTADTKEWFDNYRIRLDEWRLWLTKRGYGDRLGRGLGDIGGLSDTGLPGDNSWAFGESGIYGDLPGGRSRGGSPNGLGALGGLSGTGLPGDNSWAFGESGIYGDLPGGRSRGGSPNGLGGGYDIHFGQAGGPLGFSAYPGAVGTEVNWDDTPEEKKKSGYHNQAMGYVLVIVGGLAVLGGGLMTATGVGAGAGVPIGVMGAGTIAAGGAFIAIGNTQIADANTSEQIELQKKAAEKADAEKKAAEKKAAEQAEKDKKPPPPPPPPQPQPGDEYPDPKPKGSLPDGDGGGVGPTTIWDGDGGVGPTTIWDGDGGVGPTTIWDGDGGGGTPTTIGVLVDGFAVAGSGLRTATVQVSPNTFRF